MLFCLLIFYFLFKDILFITSHKPVNNVVLELQLQWNVSNISENATIINEKATVINCGVTKI